MLSTPLPVSMRPRRSPVLESSATTPSVQATKSKDRRTSMAIPRGPASPQPGWNVEVIFRVRASITSVRSLSSRFV